MLTDRTVLQFFRGKALHRVRKRIDHARRRGWRWIGIYPRLDLQKRFIRPFTEEDLQGVPPDTKNCLEVQPLPKV